MIHEVVFHPLAVLLTGDGDGRLVHHNLYRQVLRLLLHARHHLGQKHVGQRQHLAVNHVIHKAALAVLRHALLALQRQFHRAHVIVQVLLLIAAPEFHADLFKLLHLLVQALRVHHLFILRHVFLNSVGHRDVLLLLAKERTCNHFQ